MNLQFKVPLWALFVLIAFPWEFVPLKVSIPLLILLGLAALRVGFVTFQTHRALTLAQPLKNWEIKRLTLKRIQTFSWKDGLDLTKWTIKSLFPELWEGLRNEP